MACLENSTCRFRFQRVLQGSLVFVCCFHFLLDALPGAAPDPALAISLVPRLELRFYLQAPSTLLALLSSYCLLAAFEVRRYSGLVTGPISERFPVGPVLLLAGVRGTGLGLFELLGGTEFSPNAAHTASRWHIR